MPNLGDYERDVPFNWGAAQILVEALLATRAELSRQLPDRDQVSRRARQSWEGPDALVFDGLVQICLRDAERFAATIQGAVTELETLIQRAQWEQERRVAVRMGVMRWRAACAQFAAAGQQPPPLDWYVPQTPPIEPPNIPPVDCPATPRNAAVPPGGRTDQSSADPDQLDRWVKESQMLDEPLTRVQQRLELALTDFRGTSRWGSFDVSPLIASLKRYIGYNGSDAEWTWNIAQAFRRADAQGELGSFDGGVELLSAVKSAATMRSPRPSTHTVSTPVLERLPESRVGRNANGLIDRVDGRPAGEYVRDAAWRRGAKLSAPGASRTGIELVALDRRSGTLFHGSPLEIAAGAAALPAGRRILQRVPRSARGLVAGGQREGGLPRTWRDLNRPTASVSEPAIHQGSIPRAVESRFLRREYALLQHVNAANWHRKVPGSGTNCLDCEVATAQALQTKTPVVAPLSVPLPKRMLTMAVEGEPEWRPVASYDDVIRRMREAGPGAHGAVHIKRRSDGSSHMFHVVHDKNGIVFLDGQLGRLGWLEPDVTEIELLRYP